MTSPAAAGGACAQGRFSARGDNSARLDARRFISVFRLRGRGDRSGCNDDLYDGPFSLRLDSAIDVRQSPTTDADIDRLLLEESEENGGARLSLTGAVLGHRVDFTLREEVAGAPAVELRFTGIWYPVSETIEGDFTSDGPMGCYSSGDLTVTVSPSFGSASEFPYE